MARGSIPRSFVDASAASPGQLPEPHEAGTLEGRETWNRFAAPTPEFRERSYYHRPRAGSDGWAEAQLENPTLAGGLALRVRFRPEELPELVQWTMTGEGTYVLGLEPATCRLTGYAAEREAGRVIASSRVRPGGSDSR